MPGRKGTMRSPVGRSRYGSRRSWSQRSASVSERLYSGEERSSFVEVEADMALCVLVGDRLEGELMLKR
jgi:hypothetical protein